MKQKKGIVVFKKDKLLELDIAEYIYSFTEFCATFGFDYSKQDIEELKEYYLKKNLELDEII